MSEMVNPIQSGDEIDIGAAIQGLIEDNLRALNTAWLGEIARIDGNFVSVKQVVRASRDEPFNIVNNLLIAFPYSKTWQMQYKLSVGDIGLCIVCGRDLDLFKQNGKAVLANTPRVKVLQDSVFIPLSLYNTLPNSSVDFTLKGASGDEFTFNNGNLDIISTAKINAKTPEFVVDADSSVDIKTQTATIDAQTTTIKGSAMTCETTSATITAPTITLSGAISMSAGGGGVSLLSLLQNLATELEAVVSGKDSRGDIVCPSQIGKFSAWSAKLGGLLK